MREITFFTITIDRILKLMKDNGISKHGLARMTNISHPIVKLMLFGCE